MLHFIHGEDWFRVREREEEVASDFRKHFPSLERFVFDLEESFSMRELDEIREILSGGLFATPSLVLLRQAGNMDEGFTKNMKKILEEAIDTKETLVLITHSGKIKKTHTFIAWLLKKGKTEAPETFTPIAFKKYSEALLKKIDAKATIEPRALEQLLINSEKDTGRIFQDLTKLALYKNGKTVTVADVEAMTEEPIEQNIFAAFDRLIQGKREEALVLLRQEEKENVPIQKTLGLCAWQLRRLIEIQELAEEGKPAPLIARELKAAPFMIQKVIPHMRRFPMARLRNGVSLLAELDKGIRSGRTQPGVALDLFIWRF